MHGWKRPFQPKRPGGEMAAQQFSSPDMTTDPTPETAQAVNLLPPEGTFNGDAAGALLAYVAELVRRRQVEEL